MKLFQIRTNYGQVLPEGFDNKQYAKTIRNALNEAWAKDAKKGEKRDPKKGPYRVTRGPDHHRSH